MSIEVLVLWGLRLGISLAVIGLLLPSKKKKTILRRVVGNNRPTYMGDRSKVVEFLDDLTEKSFIKTFMLKEDSDDYLRTEDKIKKAGGLGGITPNIIQLFKILMPPIAFVLMMATYVFKIAISTVRLSPSKVEEAVNVINETSGNIQATVDLNVVKGGSGASPQAILLIVLLAMLLYVLPDMFLNNRIKARKKLMQEELPIIETFVVIMLESGNHTVYDILKALLNTTVFFKPYITMCLNEYYVDPKRAIQNMADNVNNEEFQMVCNSLKQAVDMSKEHTAEFMKQHLEQIKKIQNLQREASIKKKPMIYVFLLALPLTSVVVIWFYPWFIRAIDMLKMNF